MTDSNVKITRTAKGKKPQYFSDPAIDKLLSIVLSLTGELSVTRERLDTLERLLEENKLLNKNKIDEYQPDDCAKAVRQAQRIAYIDRIMRTVQMELEESINDDMPQSEADIIKHLS